MHLQLNQMRMLTHMLILMHLHMPKLLITLRLMRSPMWRQKLSRKLLQHMLMDRRLTRSRLQPKLQLGRRRKLSATALMRRQTTGRLHCIHWHQRHCCCHSLLLGLHQPAAPAKFQAHQPPAPGWRCFHASCRAAEAPSWWKRPQHGFAALQLLLLLLRLHRRCYLQQARRRLKRPWCLLHGPGSCGKEDTSRFEAPTAYLPKRQPVLLRQLCRTWAVSTSCLHLPPRLRVLGNEHRDLHRREPGLSRHAETQALPHLLVLERVLVLVLSSTVPAVAALSKAAACRCYLSVCPARRRALWLFCPRPPQLPLLPEQRLSPPGLVPAAAALQLCGVELVPLLAAELGVPAS